MRPKAIIPRKRLCISLPEDLLLRLELLHHSDLQGRVPYGAVGSFIEKLIVQELDRLNIEVRNHDHADT